MNHNHLSLRRPINITMSMITLQVRGKSYTKREVFVGEDVGDVVSSNDPQIGRADR